MRILHLVSFHNLNGLLSGRGCSILLVFVWLGRYIFRLSGIVWTGSLGLLFPGCFLFGGGGLLGTPCIDYFRL